MAGRFNRFGATVADILTYMTTGSYVPVAADFGGATAIEAFLDDATDDIIQMMPEAMFQSILDVQLEKVEQRAAADQVNLVTGLKPLVAGKTHVWTGAPSNFRTKPRLSTDVLADMVFTSPELIPMCELDPSAFAVTEATGAIVLTAQYKLLLNYQAYVTYTVDVDNVAFSIPSLANVVTQGAVAKMGSKFYSRSSSNWQFIDDLKEDYGKKITDLRDGQWLPNEIRQMRFWQEVIPEADKKTTMQIGRLRRG